VRGGCRSTCSLASAAWLLLIAGAARGGEVATLQLRRVAGGSGANCIEIRGVGADPFDPLIWQRNTLHFVADAARPLIEPRAGKHRNIYAPSAVEIEGGWRVYFAGWDGTDTPNDRVYCIETSGDFRSFTNRRTVIEHGEFEHVCNVNVTPAPAAGGFAMMCTAYPDAHGRNKPVTFFSPDGLRWDGATATRDRIVDLLGYPDYAAKADINGVNVLLAEDGGYRMYFGDFANGGKTWRATGVDGKHFELDRRIALDPSPLVNDVKKFRTRERRDWYLMGLHANGERLFYSVSDDGEKFPAAQTLCTSADDSDRYIVSIGWVTKGAQDDPGGRRLLGFLYGAGSTGSLDGNRIFAVWLEKKLVLTVQEKPLQHKVKALGPDRQLVFFDKPLSAQIELLGDDGRTPIARSAGEIELRPGSAYELTTIDRAAPAAAGKSR
jgi:hypothetical protein